MRRTREVAFGLLAIVAGVGLFTAVIGGVQRGVPQDPLRRELPTHYDLVVNTEVLDPDEAADSSPEPRAPDDRRYGTIEKRSIETSSPVAAGRAVASTTIRSVWMPSGRPVIERGTSNVGAGAKLSTVRTSRPST